MKISVVWVCTTEVSDCIDLSSSEATGWCEWTMVYRSNRMLHGFRLQAKLQGPRQLMFYCSWKVTCLLHLSNPLRKVPPIFKNVVKQPLRMTIFSKALCRMEA